MNSFLEPGDWVHASDSKVFDLRSRMAVGVYLRKWTGHTGMVNYVVGPKLESYAYGSYRHIRRITKAEGRLILKARKELYDERWVTRRTAKPIMDEIWEFLRNGANGASAGPDDADGTGLRLSGIIG